MERILSIYAYAREQMKKNGNGAQWGDSRPPRPVIECDIQKGTGYVIEQEGAIVGVFAFLLGEDPTYREIEGKWLNDEPYGTIHRVASSGAVRGVLRTCLEFCELQIGNVRVDTHENNAIMRHLLEKLGYQRCGIIICADGTSRIAYQKGRS